jgi:TetR/AcrR family transcriptional regulator, transcriptional repressor for nem operon
MSRGADTKRKILESTAEVFNQRGYFGSSMADILRVTGLQKGGLYNHFRSKEELALEAFDHACSVVGQRFTTALKDKTNAADALVAMVLVFRDYMDDPPIRGGCPIMNTAVESDDTLPALRQRAIEAMDRWRSRIVRLVSRGIESGEIRPEVDGDNLATIIISMVEGALLLSRLYRDRVHIVRATDSLTHLIESEVRAR